MEAFSFAVKPLVAGSYKAAMLIAARLVSNLWSNMLLIAYHL
jgi:hypothetical protein